ncbi:MAG: hypothetical protein GX424_04975 [Clostridiales bacterium]|jgi:hypothetical protein|nr:hypothetical protein [Clostridiales bacterium]
MNNSLSLFLTPEETAALQLRMTGLLAEEVLRFNGGQSSSIRTEAAQSLLESILYAVTAYLDTLPDPPAALKTRDIGELREQGIVLLRRYTDECRALLPKVRATRVQTELIAYNHTVGECFGEAFFRVYDPRFQAQAAPAGPIDYPLYRDDWSVTGILYVRNYLTQLLRENEFCARFPKNRIRALLLAHGLKHRIDYREMLQNIPELIIEGAPEQERPALEHMLTD